MKQFLQNNLLKKTKGILLNSNNQRSSIAKKNIVASFFIKGLSILVNLLLVPLTINYVNPTRYGIWITLSSIIAWFSFFDIGFGNGLRNKFTEAVAKGQTEFARIYVSTTYAILTFIIIGVLIVFLAANPFINWPVILNCPAEYSNELQTLVLIIFSFFCLQFILQLINTVLTADQKPAKASLINLIGSIFSLALIFVLTKITSGSLILLGVALSGAPVVVMIIYSFWFYHKDYRPYAPSLKHVKFGHAKDLMNLGIKFFVIQIAAIILYQTSNIVISQLFGPENVTPYNIAFKYFGIITMGFSILITPFWSAVTDAYHKEDFTWIKSTLKRLQQFWILTAIAGVVMLLASNYVYKIWVGEEIKIPFVLSFAMMLYVLLSSWCSIFVFFLNGIGKIKLQLYGGIFGGIVNIPLSIFMGKAWGINGVVFSSVILVFINAVWLPIQYSKIINHTAQGIWND